jgi:hypothetical protein
MNFEWDPVKAASNLDKHGVDFADAVLVFEDPWAITIEDTDALGEARYISLGMGPAGRLLVVVYAYRQSSIRLISARMANRCERTNYEEGIRF